MPIIYLDIITTYQPCKDKIMHAVIEEIIEGFKQDFNRCQDKPSVSKLPFIHIESYITGFLDCAYKADLIKESHYNDYMKQIAAIRISTRA